MWITFRFCQFDFKHFECYFCGHLLAALKSSTPNQHCISIATCCRGRCGRYAVPCYNGPPPPVPAEASRPTLHKRSPHKRSPHRPTFPSSCTYQTYTTPNAHHLQLHRKCWRQYSTRRFFPHWLHTRASTQNQRTISALPLYLKYEWRGRNTHIAQRLFCCRTNLTLLQTDHGCAAAK
jgi:hypothetical protein